MSADGGDDSAAKRAWLEAALDVGPVATLLLERGTARVLYANRAASRLVGRDVPRGAPAAAFHELLQCIGADGAPARPEDLPAVRAARGERLDGVAIECHGADGPRHVLCYADTAAATDDHDAVVVLSLVDVTELQRARAREQQVRLAAEEASRLTDEFLATVSHELRTPLTAILGWLHILRSRARDGAALERALATIERNTRAQVRLIEDLLDVSRIQAGTLRLALEPLDLAPVVRAAVDAIAPTADAKGVIVRLAAAPGGAHVRGDAARLQQVVWNLVSNAVKFTPPEGVVTVSVDRPDGRVRVAVADTGIGIDGAFVPHVFERFRQADASPTRPQHGLGLGLAIVRSVVEMHGGEVRAESPGVGLGATFTVLLPPHDAAREGEPAPRRPTPVPAPFSAALSTVRVLVVDDDDDTRDLVGAVLRDAGADVALASSATEALALFDARRPHVVLSDLAMPDVDGYALIRSIRARGAHDGGDTPAAALSAHVRADDAHRAFLAGFQTHIAKPVAPDTLIEVVARLASAPCARA